MATTSKVRDVISLRGSAQIIQEFFRYGLNSILYQRGIYPADTFRREKKYGLTMLVTSDPKLEEFLAPLLDQIRKWLEKKQLRKIVIVISDIRYREVLERWQFDIVTDPEVQQAGAGEQVTRNKSEKKINQEIADVMRQISASVTFLPLLEVPCSFDVLIYTGKETDTPEDWTESNACHIEGAEEVKLRSFATAIHDVHTSVSYKPGY